MQKPIKVRLILPGGGVKGSFQLGFIKSLQDSKSFEVDHVYGTSVGGLLAPFAIDNNISKMISIFDSIKSIYDIVNKWPWYINLLPMSIRVLWKMGAYKSMKLADTVIQNLSTNNSYQKCSVVSWDILKKEEIWFTGEQIRDGLKATCNLWLLVPPLKMNDTVFVDGGATQLVPIPKDDPSKKFDGIYIIVDCTNRTPVTIKKQPKNPIQLMNMLHHDASIQLAKKEVEKFKLDNNVVDVIPKHDIFNDGLEINQKKMKQYYDMGTKAFTDFAKAHG